MDTSRVDILYRPIRIAWVIKGGDFEAFRRIAKLACTLAGGRFNPIVVVDDPDAVRIVESFRPDVVIPTGDAPELKAFPDQFPHLATPWFGSDELHYPDSRGRGGCHVLDVYNLLSRWHRHREWQDVVDFGIRRFTWSDADPLKDVFLIEHGEFPTPADVHTDYAAALRDSAKEDLIIDVEIKPDQAIPEDAAKHPSIAFLGRFGVSRHVLSDYNGWNYPGFYRGEADNLDDLITYWNLRAADVRLRFIDQRHMERYAMVLPVEQAELRRSVAHLDEFQRSLAIWSRDEPGEAAAEKAKEIAGDGPITVCVVRPALWNGLNMKPPTMVLGSANALGVIVDKYERATASFALGDKPFSEEIWFHQQKLVASISMFQSRQDQEGTFQIPYVPELNEKLGRATRVGYADFRAEQGRIGIVVDATTTDLDIASVPPLELVENIFEAFGMKASLSNAGLITRQLISQMGGLESTRAFKIPGVRRLIRKSGLNKSVTKSAAVKLIGERDPQNPTANFKDHKRLFIESRDTRTDLSPEHVFTHLVAKRVFRIGADIYCHACRLPSWIPLDDLKQTVACGYCGTPIDTTRQLAEGQMTYRRSGLLGIERNMQGAIPVTLVLQQLWNNVLHGAMRGAVWMPSLNVEATDGIWEKPCEIDFFAIELSPQEGRHQGKRTRVVIGEAKDRGNPDAEDNEDGVARQRNFGIDENDAETMKKIAVQFPSDRFEVYIVFAKLSAFTDDEIAIASELSQSHNVILLTDQELEPYYIYERGSEELKRSRHGLDGLVQGTRIQYPTMKPKRPFLQPPAAEEAKPPKAAKSAKPVKSARAKKAGKSAKLKGAKKAAKPKGVKALK